MEQEKDSSRTEGRADRLGAGWMVLITSGEAQRHSINYGPCLPSSSLCISDQILSFCWERGEL